MTIPIYVGYDAREAVAFHVFCHSVLANTRARVQFIPISGEQRAGESNRFIYERYNAARHAGFRGRAIYADSDMLLRPGADIEELYDLAEPYCAVTVAQHNYETKFPVKYWGQKNENYPRKNWSSLMVIDCNHAAWQRGGKYDHRFAFLGDDNLIGELPLEWNWLVGEYGYEEGVKLAHYTLGIPPYFDYSGTDSEKFVAEWWEARATAMGIV